MNCETRQEAVVAAPLNAAPGDVLVRVRGLVLAHGDKVIQRGIDFDILAGEVLAIVGGSGSGKSTLLRHLIGLQEAREGSIVYVDGEREDELVHADNATMNRLRRRFGVMFQTGALWSAMSVLENLTLPLELYSDLDRPAREAKARERLEAVDLADAIGKMPSDLSGGMRKRVALARALVLDPPLVYLDEPAAGLDPINTVRLDRTIDRLAEAGTAIVMVTHAIPSVVAVADRMLFLDADERRMTALGPPRQLLASGPPAVQQFIRAGLEGQIEQESTVP